MVHRNPLARLPGLLQPLRIESTDAEVERRHAGSDEGRIVFAGGTRFALALGIDPERLRENRPGTLGQRCIVDHRPGPALAQGDLRYRRAGHLRTGQRGTSHAVEQLVAHLRVLAADGAAQLRAVGDDVASRAGVERSNADHAKRSRVFFATDHALHIDNEARRDQDRIDRRGGHRPMPALALEHHLQRIGVGGHRPGLVEHMAVGIRTDMQGKAVVRLAEPGKQAIVKHRLRTATLFLRWLGDEHQRAAPLGAQLHQGCGRADPGRHVNVVTAGMRHIGIAVTGLQMDVAGVRQPRGFPHRQRI